MPDNPNDEEIEFYPGEKYSVKKQMIEAEIEHAQQGRLAGILVLILGAILLLLGATGVVDLGLGGLGHKAAAANASPGVVAMLIGLVIIWRNNLKIKSAKLR